MHLCRDSPEKYFDDWASEHDFQVYGTSSDLPLVGAGQCSKYEAVMRGWGYNLPEIVADKLRRLLGCLAGLRVLDLACGDGMVGAALRAMGADHITGMDISAKMLSRAAATGVYNTTTLVDIRKPLPSCDNWWDIVVRIIFFF